MAVDITSGQELARLERRFGAMVPSRAIAQQDLLNLAALIYEVSRRGRFDRQGFDIFELVISAFQIFDLVSRTSSLTLMVRLQAVQRFFVSVLFLLKLLQFPRLAFLDGEGIAIHALEYCAAKYSSVPLHRVIGSA